MKTIVCLMSALFISASVLASVVTIEGKSVIIPGKPDQSKAKAIEAAMQGAVEAFVTTLVTKPVADANYAKLQPAIYSVNKDFITKYEVASERQDAQFYYVEIKADIDDAKINGQLAALGIQPGVGGKPTVAVFASEQNLDGSWSPSYYSSFYGNSAVGEANFNVCEGVIMNAVSGAGFPIVDMTLDPSEVKQAYKYKPVFERYDENMLNIPNDNAAKLAKVMDKDVGIVITCTALAKNQGKKSSMMNSISANVSCKAVNVKSNARIASATVSAAVPHIDPITGGNKALEKACTEVADKIVTALADKY